MKRLFLTIVALLLVIMIFAESTDLIKCGGCKTEYFLIKAIAEGYQKESGVKIMPSSIGNKKAVQLFADSKLDFVFICKTHEKLVKKFGLPSDKTKSWKSVKIAQDPIVIVINEGAGIDNLTLQQVKDIFSGKVKNWKEVGGKDLSVKVVYMDDSVESGAVTVFKETTVGKDNSLVKAEAKLKAPNQCGHFCSQTSGAVTFMGINSYKDTFGIKAKIDGFAPESKNIISGDYPISVTYHIAYDTTKEEKVKSFLDYIASGAGKKIVGDMMVSISD